MDSLKSRDFCDYSFDSELSSIMQDVGAPLLLISLKFHDLGIDHLPLEVYFALVRHLCPSDLLASMRPICSAAVVDVNEE